MIEERVLIIEHDPKYVEFLLASVLLPSGYQAQTATCEHIGLNTIQQANPDLILLGWDLQNMDNTTVLQRLQVLGAPPVILMVPPGAEVQALRAFRLGVSDVLIKPSTPQEILEAVARVLHRERLAGERDALVRKLAAANEELERAVLEFQTLYQVGKKVSSSLDLQAVLRAVVQAAVSITHAEESYLLLRDSSEMLCLRAAQNLSDEHCADFYVSLEDSIAGYVARTGEPVVLSSEGNASIKVKSDYFVRSLVNVPLQSQNQIIGVLGVNNVTSQQSLTSREVMLLSALADYAVVAMNNAQMYTHTDQTLDRCMQEMLALQAVTDISNRSDDELCIIRQALAQAVRVSGAVEGQARLWVDNPPGEPVLRSFVQAALEVERNSDHKETSLDDVEISSNSVLARLVRQALDSDAPHWVQDAFSSNGTLASSFYVAVPIPGREGALGAIGLRLDITGVGEQCKDPFAFIQQDIQFLTKLATWSADRLDQTRLCSQISAAQRRVESILANIEDGVCLLDKDLNVTLANLSVERITGWKAQDLLGRRYDEIFAPQAEGKALAAEQTLPGRALATQSDAEAQFTILCRDGRRVPIMSRATLLKDVQTEKVSVLTTMRDLRVPAQDDPRRHTLAELTDRWLRVSLDGVDASVDALWKPDLPQQVRQELLDALEIQGVELERIAKKTRDLVQLDRDTQLSNNHPVTLRPVIDQVARRFQANFGRSLQVSLTPDLPFVMGDEQKIELALTHLIESVLIMTDKGASIQVSTTVDNGAVVVEVECSTRAGVAAEWDDHAAPLQRAVYKLGLYIVEKLIQTQGGRFWTETRTGTGTRFLFSLPEMEGMDVAQAFID